jgi:hypothetical protein
MEEAESITGVHRRVQRKVSFPSEANHYVMITRFRQHCELNRFCGWYTVIPSVLADDTRPKTSQVFYRCFVEGWFLLAPGSAVGLSGISFGVGMAASVFLE